MVCCGALARGIPGEMNSAPALSSKLEDQLRGAIRRKHFSLKTEECYVGWYRRYVLWHGKRHPREMGAEEVEAFDSLAPLAHPLGLASG